MTHEAISSEIVRSTPACRISRVEVRRDPMLGALVEAGPCRQTRIIESGGLLVGPPGDLRVLGRGHAIDLPPAARFLYLPIAAGGPLVEWVLAIEPDARAEDVPVIRREAPVAEPIAVPTSSADHAGRYPAWAEPWLGLPADVATWASGLDVRGTSLTQRMQRLVGESPKKVLSAARATIAFELAEHYRGEGAALAVDVGYSSQSHLARDVRDRFGMSLTHLVSEDSGRELAWLRLVKSVVR